MPATVRAALADARVRGVERLDAQLLLTHLLGQPREWLLAHDDEALTATQAADWAELLERRAAGEPVAYLTGQRPFCGLVLRVSPAVLIPRPETEDLVRWALELRPRLPSTEVVDLGTGSGAIALAVKHGWPAASVCASDASEAALGIARANAETLRLHIELQQGDWWAPWQGRRFGLALSNPPYVAGVDPHLAALRHEPRIALTPEGDGLGALRQIVQRAPEHLLPGAWLLLEHGHDQGEAVRAMLTGRGFEQAQTRLDLAGLARCSGALWPAHP